MVIYPELGARDKIKACILWNQPKGILKDLPNLRWISSLGAGVDHILEDPDLKPGIKVSRIVDNHLAMEMTKMAFLAVLSIEKEFPQHLNNQHHKLWRPNLDPIKRSIGVLGLGYLGKQVAIHLSDLGYQVSGFSKSVKKINGVECYHGNQQLPIFLKKSQILICLLPLTPATENFLNLNLFEQLPQDAYIINLGRGRHLVEEDLLKALDLGIIKGAYLDVFRKEPLSQTHPFWTRREIIITPHIASLTNVQSAAGIIVENYHRFLHNKKLKYEIDLDKSY